MLRSRRLIAPFALVALCLVGTACAGSTTGATDITRTSARLMAQGSCDRDCSYLFRFARTVDSGWPERSATLRPYTTRRVSGIGSTGGKTVPFGEPATSLLPSTTYRYQACGRDAGYSSDVCVGPDGGTGTSSSFTTRPGDYVYGTGSVFSDDVPLGTLTVHATAGPAGEAPEGSANGTGRYGTQFGGTVTCLRVEGPRAVVGTPDFFFFLEDGAGDQPDRYGEARTDGQSSACPPVRTSGYTGSLTGIAINDATA